MSLSFSNPDRAPTPAELSAWADGELVGPAVRHVESWLAAHPEAALEVEQSRRLTQLYRDHAPPEPGAAAWQGTLDRIDDRLRRPTAAPTRGAGRAWPWRLLLGLVSAAALFGGVALARALWPADAAKTGGEIAEQQTAPRAEPADDEVFPVATAGEVDILSIDPRDADRVVLDLPLLGEFDLAAPADIVVIAREPGPEDGPLPRLFHSPDAKVPLVVALDDEDDDDN